MERERGKGERCATEGTSRWSLAVRAVRTDAEFAPMSTSTSTAVRTEFFLGLESKLAKLGRRATVTGLTTTAVKLQTGLKIRNYICFASFFFQKIGTGQGDTSAKKWAPSKHLAMLGGQKRLHFEHIYCCKSCFAPKRSKSPRKNLILGDVIDKNRGHTPIFFFRQTDILGRRYGHERTLRTAHQSKFK